MASNTEITWMKKETFSTTIPSNCKQYIKQIEINNRYSTDFLCFNVLKFQTQRLTLSDGHINFNISGIDHEAWSTLYGVAASTDGDSYTVDVSTAGTYFNSVVIKTANGLSSTMPTNGISIRLVGIGVMI